MFLEIRYFSNDIVHKLNKKLNGVFTMNSGDLIEVYCHDRGWVLTCVKSVDAGTPFAFLEDVFHDGVFGYVNMISSSEDKWMKVGSEEWRKMRVNDENPN